MNLSEPNRFFDKNSLTFESITQSAAFGFAVLDANCVIQYSNAACAELFELDQSALIHQELESFLAEESKGLISRFEELSSRSVSSLELQINLKNGETRRIQAKVQPLKNQNGAACGLACSFQDATSQIDAQLALIREFAFQSELEDLGRQIIGQRDFNTIAQKAIDCCLSFCNWQVVGLFFRTLDDSTIDSKWKTRGDQAFPDSVKKELSVISSPLTSSFQEEESSEESSRVHDIKNWTPELKAQLAELNLATFHKVDLWMGDQCIGVLAAAETTGDSLLAEDLGRIQNIALLVTSALQNAHLFHRLQLNNQTLENTVDQLEDANRHRDQFYRFLIHDLNKPLAAIVGTSNRILKRNDLDDGLIDRLSRINNSSLRLRDYVEEMLNYEKIRRGEISLKIKKVRVLHELNDLAEMISEKHAEVKISVIQDSALEDAFVIQTDSVHLQRVLQNLMDNAAKYGDGLVECHVSTEYENTLIRIWNSGDPIPKDDRNAIFEEFFQRGGKRSEGFGIGLASVKHLVNHLGGKISVECPDRGGTEFILTFPTKWIHEPDS